MLRLDLPSSTGGSGGPLDLRHRFVQAFRIARQHVRMDPAGLTAHRDRCPASELTIICLDRVVLRASARRQAEHHSTESHIKFHNLLPYKLFIQFISAALAYWVAVHFLVLQGAEYLT